MRPTSQISKPLYKALRQLGLGDNDALAYATALQLGPSTVSAIAENLDIARPNAYKLVQSLERMGLARVSGESYGRTVSVEPPSTVLEKLRQKERALEGVKQEFVSDMPDLLQLFRQGEGPAKVKLLAGQKQFLRAFNQILEEEKYESQFCGSAKDFIGFISWKAERDWIKRRVAKGIRIRTLLLPSKEVEELKRTNRQELRETRLLTRVKPFSSSFQLFANRVIIWQPKAPLAILIEDQYVVTMLRNIFDAMWEQSKP
ncbi:MAG: helix-turn-helix domain-containing protein [bacterium]|nr:helix-turn-helix domain-containing protein [bacterium]